MKCYRCNTEVKGNACGCKDGCTIVHGDCRQVLPELRDIDITVSSPPYNMIPPTKPSGLLKEHRCKKSESYASYIDCLQIDEYTSFIVHVFSMCLESTLGVVWVNHKTRFKNRVAIHPIRFLPFPIFAEVVWSRPGSTTLNANRYAPSHEYIIGFGSPHFWDRCNDTKLTVWHLPPETNVDGHPCPFPEVIPHRLISSSCPPGGIVLDPFMGSGTTLRAAKGLGCRAIGIEIEEKYCELAAIRLQQEVLF